MTQFIIVVCVFYTIKTLLRFVSLVVNEKLNGEDFSQEDRIVYGISVAFGVAIVSWGVFLLLG